MRNGKKNKKWVKPVMIALIVLLSLVLLVLILGGIMLHKFHSMWGSVETLPTNQSILSSKEIATIEQETDPVESGYTGVILAPEEVTWATEPAPTIGHEPEIINILLIGQDRRPGQGRQRSDAMILCTINLDAKTLTMTSFLRDLYVQIPMPDGNYDTRLNHAYQYGGAQLLNDTLALNFGVHVDGNVAVDFDSFIELVDIMGGVSINLTQAEANLLIKYGHSVRAGVNNLNGKEALAYSRIRIIGTDFARTNRQRTVLNSMLQSCKNADITTLTNLMNEVLKIVATDMTSDEILDYMMKILPILRDLEVKTQTIPTRETYTSARIRGMSVLVPDLEAVRQILQESLVG